MPLRARGGGGSSISLTRPRALNLGRCACFSQSPPRLPLDSRAAAACARVFSAFSANDSQKTLTTSRNVQFPFSEELDERPLQNASIPNPHGGERCSTCSSAGASDSQPAAPLAAAAVHRRCSTVCSWQPAACGGRAVPAEFDVSAH